MSDLKFLGIRVYEPRSNYPGSSTLPMDLVMTRKGYLDHSVEVGACTIEFLKLDSETQFRTASFNLRTSRIEAMKLVAKLMEKYENHLGSNGWIDTPKVLISFLATLGIPVVYYDPLSGGFYSDPNIKRFVWYHNGNRQGSVFAATEKDAVKRIKREIGLDPKEITLEVAPMDTKEATQYFKPEWIA